MHPNRIATKTFFTLKNAYPIPAQYHTVRRTSIPANDIKPEQNKRERGRLENHFVRKKGEGMLNFDAYIAVSRIRGIPIN